MVKVFSLGGSIVVPDRVDIPFLQAFLNKIIQFLQDNPDTKLILVVGGGGPARTYQEALKALSNPIDSRNHQDTSDINQRLDWIGIMATRLNAELVKQSLGTWCTDPVVLDPTGPITFTGRVLVGAGWKPGFSTDYDAVVLADRFQATEVVNLSNISQVYTADPKQDPQAKPLESISWEDFTALVGEDWKPGSNLPFDPIATKLAKEKGLKVIAAGGRDLVNLENLLHNKPFIGTVIG